MFWLVFLLLFVMLLIAIQLEDRATGVNSTSFDIKKLLKLWMHNPLKEWRKIYKREMNKLDKKGFDEFKCRGVYDPKKRPWMVSRGFYKIKDILTQTGVKVHGNVLSLACGRGGWEQVICAADAVKNVTCVTYGPSKGTLGHEEFSNVNWPGKDKIELIYDDIRNFVKLDTNVFHTVLFDGGEQHPDPDKETNRFHDLFKDGVLPSIHRHSSFILKILCPEDPRILDLCQQIVAITGKGKFVRCSHSRNSNLELYFVSGRPSGSLSKEVKNLLKNAMESAQVDENFVKVLEPRAYDPSSLWKGVNPDVPLDPLDPLDMSVSIGQLGPRILDNVREFAHWVSLGIYPFGPKGGSGTKRVQLAYDIIRRIAGILSGFMDWTSTNTTPEGFERVFYRKVDVPPNERSSYHKRLTRIFDSMTTYFIKKNFFYHVFNDDELQLQANRRGAATNIDPWNNTGDFLIDPNRTNIMNSIEQGLINGNPSHSVFFTMGKREKKKNGHKGSRMVAYLPIPMRMVEMKYFGAFKDLVTPVFNRFCVGGVGLHDYGNIIAKEWKDAAISEDIAGFDTKVGKTVLSMVCKMFLTLAKHSGASDRTIKIMHSLYRVYANPHLLIPLPNKYGLSRSELLVGSGQVMSGNNPTYTGNSLIMLAISLLRISILDEVEDRDIEAWVHSMFDQDVATSDWNLKISGDNALIMSDLGRVHRVSKSWFVLNDLGFPRKDMARDADSHIIHNMSNADFCSHTYEPVTFFDSYNSAKVTRYMPTRPVAEILAKCTIWIGTTDNEEDEEAWIATQANNLLVNYSHMRDIRRVGLALKSVVPDNIILTDKGAKFLPKPWITNGDLLDIINDCLFGNSTIHSIPGFRVRELSSLGYMKYEREKVYEKNFNHTDMIRWRTKLPNIVLSYIRSFRAMTSFNYNYYLSEMSRYSTQLL